MAARYHTSAAVQPDRGQVLQEGRDAAIARRRADSQRCRDRVAEVIEMMRRTRIPLSDAEITRRARVNRQYLQRHRVLTARAAKIRADLDGDAARVAVAARSEREAALAAENGVLVEQNAPNSELSVFTSSPPPPPACSPVACPMLARPSSICVVNAMRRSPRYGVRRLTSRRCATLNQRLMVENSHLLQAVEHPPGEIGATVLHIEPQRAAERVRQLVDSPVTPSDARDASSLDS